MASSLLQYAYMATLTRSKIIVTYPYSNVMIKDFEEGVHGEHSLSPTRVGFDSKLILNKNGRKLLSKYNSELKRYVTFIEFYDENNQYKNSELKPKPYGYIEQIHMDINSFLELVKNVDLESENGSFGVFDLYFDVGSSELIYYKNELYIPLMKKTSLQKEELSIYTLLRRKEHIKNGYLSEKNKEEAKSHSWIKDMYSAGLYMFLIKYLLENMGWKIKKIHRLYAFKQKNGYRSM